MILLTIAEFLQAGAFETEYDDERADVQKPAGDVGSNE